LEVTKIYMDMDGVLAWFDKGVADLCGISPQNQDDPHTQEDIDRLWDAVRKVPHFYDRLEIMPGSEEMFRILMERYPDRCEILTGVPRPSRQIADASEDKVRWMRRLLSPTIPVHTVLRKEKIDYCQGPGTILIDDLGSTIRKWRKAGGTGVLHVSPEQTLRELKELGVL